MGAVVDRAAAPVVPGVVRRVLRAAQALTTPALPDAYLELVNPRWSTRELVGVIQEIRPETPDTATVVIAPSRLWPGHRPGQYLRLGVEIDGVRHWRAFTLTSDPGHGGGVVALTVKLAPGGLMSHFLLDQARPGSLVYLGDVEGQFCLDQRPVEPLLFIGAGSGITPLFALLRRLEANGWLDDVVLVYCVRTPADVIFGDHLRALAARQDRFRLLVHHSSSHGRLAPPAVGGLVPDWRQRRTYLSGPPAMLTAFTTFWDEQGERDHLEIERFQPRAGADIAPGAGGTVRFRISGTDVVCDGSTPMLVAGERAGLELRHGCRMGVCRTCVGRLAEGRVRDLRSGRVGGEPGDLVRICVHGPEGAVEIDL